MYIYIYMCIYITVWHVRANNKSLCSCHNGMHSTYWNRRHMCTIQHIYETFTFEKNYNAFDICIRQDILRTLETYIHICMYAYIHTPDLEEISQPVIIHRLHTYIHTRLHTHIHTYMHACMHIHIHTYIHTYIYKYIHRTLKT